MVRVVLGWSLAADLPGLPGDLPPPPPTEPRVPQGPEPAAAGVGVGLRLVPRLLLLPRLNLPTIGSLHQAPHLLLVDLLPGRHHHLLHGAAEPAGQGPSDSGPSPVSLLSYPGHREHRGGGGRLHLPTTEGTHFQHSWRTEI